MMNVRFDKLGNVVWAKTLGGVSEDWSTSIAATGDGNYVVTGNHYSFAMFGGRDLWVMKFDIDGNMIWQRTVGSSVEDYGTGVDGTPDGGAIVTGYGNEAWLIKISRDGFISGGCPYGSFTCTVKDYTLTSVDCAPTFSNDAVMVTISPSVSALTPTVLDYCD